MRGWAAWLVGPVLPAPDNGAFVLLLPITDGLVFWWTLGLMLAFAVGRELVLRRRRTTDLQDLAIAQDSVVFAGSVIMLMAAVEPPVLKAVADLRLPLLTLGLAGLRFSWRAMLRA